MTRKLLLPLIVAMLALSACGGGSTGHVSQTIPESKPTTTLTVKTGIGSLGEAKEALVKAGIPCAGAPSPYVKDPNAMEFGTPPVSSLECGGGLTVELYASKSIREGTQAASLLFACAFGISEFNLAVGDGLMAYLDDAHRSGEISTLNKVAVALNIDAKHHTCPAGS